MYYAMSASQEFTEYYSVLGETEPTFESFGSGASGFSTTSPTTPAHFLNGPHYANNGGLSSHSYNYSEEGGEEGDTLVWNAAASSSASTSSWILVILLTSIIVITIVGNILVCLAVILVRKLRKPQNYLLVSLATSDLFVALFVMPFAIVSEFHENQWPLNPALCDLFVSGNFFSIF